MYIIPNAAGFDRSAPLLGALAPKQSRSRKRGGRFWIAAPAKGSLAMTGVAAGPSGLLAAGMGRRSLLCRAMLGFDLDTDGL